MASHSMGFAKNSVYPFLVAAILSLPAVEKLAVAQDLIKSSQPLSSDTPESNPFDITGMTEAEVLEILGEPDKRDTSRRAHQWLYQNAIVFITEGRVIAWTNVDVLDRIKRSRDLERSISAPSEGPGEAVMGWKPDESATPRAVLDDLLDVEVPQNDYPARPVDTVSPVTAPSDSIDSLFVEKVVD